MKTFEELAKSVSNQIKQDMVEDDFESFSDMVKCNWWTPEDIRGYICDCVKMCGGDCYDDLSYIEIDAKTSGFCEAMQYGKFKRLVTENLK